MILMEDEGGRNEACVTQSISTKKTVSPSERFSLKQIARSISAVLKI